MTPDPGLWRSAVTPGAPLRTLLGTMYFLFFWIYWGSLVYLSSAQFSLAAPTQAKEQKPTEVVPFMTVYERSMCQVRETLVDIYQEYPDEVEFIFKPSCVPLMRCSGCCSDENFECVPTEWSNVTMQILRVKPHVIQSYIDKSFQQHTRCECREKKEIKVKQENPCEPCAEKRKHLFVQDPQTCTCSCKNTDSHCKMKQLELNEKTCRCEKPRR